MRRAVAAFAVVAATGCGAANPVQPDVEVIEAKVQYVCLTQPREYVLPSGEHVWEIDWYSSDTPCPAVPIP